jgi:preprotein translocase subunit Sec63
MEGYLRWKNGFLFTRVWVVVEEQLLTFYEFFDTEEGQPKKVKGSLDLKNAEIIKLASKHSNDPAQAQHGLKIKTTTKGSKATFLCSDANTWNQWFSALLRISKFHEEEADRIKKPLESREILGIPEDKFGKLTKSMITRSYKRLSLKEHPDKGNK